MEAGVLAVISLEMGEVIGNQSVLLEWVPLIWAGTFNLHYPGRRSLAGGEWGTPNLGPRPWNLFMQPHI